MGWPRIIYVRGVGIPVESWDEIDELVKRYGSDIQGLAQVERETALAPVAPTGRSGLGPSDQALLSRFVEAGRRGISTRDLATALGRRGKAIRPALDSWSRKVGLVSEVGVTAFEATRGTHGRGFRLTDHFQRAARNLLAT